MNMDRKSKKPKDIKDVKDDERASSAREESENVAEAEKNEEKKKLSGRKRKRKMLNEIREQMEFYFGDSNLNKDRFMKKLIEDDPYVPLSVFLTFNKIKSIADSEEMIAKSLSKSDILELDETNKKVRRKTALNPDENVDDRTIYVEALPSNVDHDWLKNMFSRFGTVTYVSLPKYAQSRKPKDFGFIEFQKEKSVVKAVNAFKAFNGVLSLEETDPAQLASIKAHNNQNAPPEKKAKKRSSQNEQDCVQAKRLKLENASSSSDTGSCLSDSSHAEGEPSNTKNKRRKHKKSAEKRKKQLELSTDATFYELKVLPKRDWKRLRNKYLNLQREKTSELKRRAAKERQEQQAKENAAATTTAETKPQVPAKKSRQEERKLHKMKMNFYGAGADSEQPTTKQAATKNIKNIVDSKPSMKFEHGLIVEVKFDKPCVDIKNFKQQMRQNKTVKYVDIKEGATEAYLRLEKPSDAEEFIGSNNSAERKLNVLSGETETEYWNKIERDRQMKLNKEIKIPSKRGREKVKAALAKHIWFGDEECE